jgi:hypothetical protein
MKKNSKWTKYIGSRVFLFRFSSIRAMLDLIVHAKTRKNYVASKVHHQCWYYRCLKNSNGMQQSMMNKIDIEAVNQASKQGKPSTHNVKLEEST